MFHDRKQYKKKRFQEMSVHFKSDGPLSQARKAVCCMCLLRDEPPVREARRNLLRKGGGRAISGTTVRPTIAAPFPRQDIELGGNASCQIPRPSHPRRPVTLHATHETKRAGGQRSQSLHLVALGGEGHDIHS